MRCGLERDLNYHRSVSKGGQTHRVDKSVGWSSVDQKLKCCEIVNFSMYTFEQVIEQPYEIIYVISYNHRN